MILGAKTIKHEVKEGRIIIDPFNPDSVGPNSVDLYLGPTLTRVRCNRFIDDLAIWVMDPKMPQKFDPPTRIPEEDGLLIFPGEMWLGHTIEIAGSRHYVPMLEGRSSVGRMWIEPHKAAGVGDVGFLRQWTLELDVTVPTILYPGMKLCQVIFHEVTDNELQYDTVGRYANQEGPQVSLYSLRK